MATTKDQLNRYFAMIDRRVPTRVSQFIRWLRKPSSFAVRLVVALVLIVGGFFSFLPILGLWMLPLGLLFIAQDVPLLQKPLVAALTWVEAKWDLLKKEVAKLVTVLGRVGTSYSSNGSNETIHTRRAL